MRIQCQRCKNHIKVDKMIALTVLEVGRIVCSHCGGLIELKTDEQITISGAPSLALQKSKERTDWKKKMIIK